MIAGFKKMPYMRKIIVVMLLALTFTLVISTFQEVRVTLKIIEQNAQDNVSLLTEQVLINMEQSQEKLGKQIYTNAATLNIPQLMLKYDQSPDISTRQSLQYALDQMVTNSSAYDFVLIETKAGAWFNTGLKPPGYSGQRDDPAAAGRDLLEHYPENTYGAWKWMNDSQGSVYILNDVYSSAPLRHSGRIILRIRTDRLIRIGRNSSDVEYSIIFCKPSSSLIFSVGKEINKELEKRAVGLIGQSRASGRVSIGRGDYYVAVYQIDDLWAIGIYATSHMISASRDVLRTGVLFSALCLSAATAAILLMLRPLSKQINVLTKTMDSVAAGNMTCKVPVMGEDDISQMAIHFNAMIEKILELLDRVVKEESQKNRAEFQLLEHRYRNLQMQINPHFIYNALETINALAKISGNTDISGIAQRISRYFRSITVNMNKQFITVDQELRTLQDYVRIYDDIYHKKLTANYICDPMLRKNLLPTMILQPIVENALIHGLAKVEEHPVLTLKVEALDGKKLQFCIANNGPAIMEHQCIREMSRKNGNGMEHSGIGLANVMERLRILYGKEASLKISGSEQGTLVTIEIPLSCSNPFE